MYTPQSISRHSVCRPVFKLSAQVCRSEYLKLNSIVSVMACGSFPAFVIVNARFRSVPHFYFLGLSRKSCALWFWFFRGNFIFILLMSCVIFVHFTLF